MSDFRKAMEGLKEARQPERAGAHGPKLVPVPSQTAKSTDPEYVAVKIFIRRKTHKVSRRKWEDAGNGDFSDLAEKLFSDFNDA
jgi:hypothetical protein